MNKTTIKTQIRNLKSYGKKSKMHPQGWRIVIKKDGREWRKMKWTVKRMDGTLLGVGWHDKTCF